MEHKIPERTRRLSSLDNYDHPIRHEKFLGKCPGKLIIYLIFLDIFLFNNATNTPMDHTPTTHLSHICGVHSIIKCIGLSRRHIYER